MELALCSLLASDVNAPSLVDCTDTRLALADGLTDSLHFQSTGSKQIGDLAFADPPCSRVCSFGFASLNAIETGSDLPHACAFWQEGFEAQDVLGNPLGLTPMSLRCN
jgi:hypothetical protein